MPFSPRVMSTASHCARGRNARAVLARVVVGPDAMVRRNLGFLMIRRDQGRARIAREVRNLRIDDQRHRPG